MWAEEGVVVDKVERGGWEGLGGSAVGAREAGRAAGTRVALATEADQAATLARAAKVVKEVGKRVALVTEVDQEAILARVSKVANVEAEEVMEAVEAALATAGAGTAEMVAMEAVLAVVAAAARVPLVASEARVGAAAEEARLIARLSAGTARLHSRRFRWSRIPASPTAPSGPR